jgi:hypothetical protein
MDDDVDYARSPMTFAYVLGLAGPLNSAVALGSQWTP